MYSRRKPIQPVRIPQNTNKQSDFDYLKDEITSELIYSVYVEFISDVSAASAAMGFKHRQSLIRLFYAVPYNYNIFFEFVLKGLADSISATKAEIKAFNTRHAVKVVPGAVEHFEPKSWQQLETLYSVFDTRKSERALPGYSTLYGISVREYRRAFSDLDTKTRSFEAFKSRVKHHLDQYAVELERRTNYAEKVLQRLCGFDVRSIMPNGSEITKDAFKDARVVPSINFDFENAPVDFEYFVNVFKLSGWSLRDLHDYVYQSEGLPLLKMSALYWRGVLDFKPSLPAIIKRIEQLEDRALDSKLIQFNEDDDLESMQLKVDKAGFGLGAICLSIGMGPTAISRFLSGYWFPDRYTLGLVIQKFNKMARRNFDKSVKDAEKYNIITAKLSEKL